MVLFDIRTDDSHAGFIAGVNRGLDGLPGNPYLASFGPVCSPHWWACLDRGELPLEVLTGEVSFVGMRAGPSFDEPEDVVEFVCGGQPQVYDRLNHWAAHPIRVGDRVNLARTVVKVQTRTGPMRYLVDLRAEWLPATGGRRPS